MGPLFSLLDLTLIESFPEKQPAYAFWPMFRGMSNQLNTTKFLDNRVMDLWEYLEIKLTRIFLKLTQHFHNYWSGGLWLAYNKNAVCNGPNESYIALILICHFNKFVVYIDFLFFLVVLMFLKIIKEKREWNEFKRIGIFFFFLASPNWNYIVYYLRWFTLKEEWNTIGKFIPSRNSF